jgi:hypothetical protein
MLDKATDVRSLISDRTLDYEQRVESMVGHRARTWFRSINFIIGAILNLLRFPRLQTHILSINGDEITQRKNFEKEVLSPEGFVSTNDVITSWFISTFKVSFTMMAINLRNRLAGITEKHAGNYEHAITYGLDDAASPSIIRKSLATLQSRSKWIPSWWNLWGGNNGLISNWSTFYRDISFTGAQTVLHMPLVSLVSSVQYPLRAMAIIFKATKDKTGMMLFTRGHRQGVLDSSKQGGLLHDMRVEF